MLTRLLAGTATALLLTGPVLAQDAAPTAPADGTATPAPADGAKAPATADATSTADAATVLATVNGTDITLGNIVALRERLPEQYQQIPDEVLFQGMLDQLIQQQVLSDIVSEDLTPTDELGLQNETRAYLAGRMIDRLSEGAVDDAALQAAYDAQYASAEPAPEYNASHILVETEEEARALKAQADDGADFAELARENSTGPSGPSGGELGWFGPGMMVPEFEEVAATLAPGEVSEPVQTQFGWHVIRLNEVRDQAAPTLEEVRPQLEEAVRAAALEAEVKRLTDEADVTRAEVQIDPSVIRDTDLLEN